MPNLSSASWYPGNVDSCFSMLCSNLSPSDKKTESHNQLQERIQSMPSNNHLVIFGDINTHVGQALSWNGAWSGTRSGYGIGVGE